MDRIKAHASTVGGLPIARALPTAARRRIGAWCFADHAGPADLAPPGMRVAPHPHTGLQTFSWMIEGEILHRDSLGSEQVLRPGQVNLMTAGRGIAHSEESLTDRLHLAQLWIALPESERFCAPAFEHFPELPRLHNAAFELTLLAGSHGGARSPIPLHTPLLGLDIAGTGPLSLPLDPAFEHGLMLLDGRADLLAHGELLYLPPGTETLNLNCEGPSRLLLLGGEPMEEPVLLWWNFVGRSSEEIQRFAEEWNSGTGAFAGVAVHGYDGERLLAPDASGLRLRAT